MSSRCDDGDEMPRHQEFDERTTEALLRGTGVPGTGHRDLAEVIAALRSSASVQPQPDDALRQIFSEGVGDPESERALTGNGPAPLPAGRWRGRRSSLRRPLARLAGIGLLAKLVLAATAVTAAALGGAGAAGILPGQSGSLPPTPEPDEAEADVGQDAADDVTEDRSDPRDVVDGLLRHHDIRGPDADGAATEPSDDADPGAREHDDVHEEPDRAGSEDADTGREAPAERGPREADDGPRQDDERGDPAPDATPSEPEQRSGGDVPSGDAPPPGDEAPSGGDPGELRDTDDAGDDDQGGATRAPEADVDSEPDAEGSAAP